MSRHQHSHTLILFAIDNFTDEEVSHPEYTDIQPELECGVGDHWCKFSYQNPDRLAGSLPPCLSDLAVYQIIWNHAGLRHRRH